MQEMPEMLVWSLGQEDLLEKEMAFLYSSILSREIAWILEPSELQFNGSQKSWTCNAKECSNYQTIAVISQASKLRLKILQARL